MSKFKIKMKLQGLELEIEGAREDAQLITQNLSQQMAGLMQPAGAILEGEVIREPALVLPANAEERIAGLRRRTRRQRTGSATASGEAANVADWQHDPTKFGMPKKEWNTATKSIWLLYVASEAASISELTASAIANTFNKHYKQAGLLKHSNVSRDLGKAKIKSPALVVEDTTKNPSPWLLTAEGRKHAQQLITEVLAEAA